MSVASDGKSVINNRNKDEKRLLVLIFKLSYHYWCREAGVLVRNLDITIGEVRVNLNEDFLLKEKGLSDTSPDPASEVVQANKESGSAKKQQGKEALSAVCKYTSIFPEKVDLISTALTLLFCSLSPHPVLSCKVNMNSSALFVGITVYARRIMMLVSVRNKTS